MELIIHIVTPKIPPVQIPVTPEFAHKACVQFVNEGFWHDNTFYPPWRISKIVRADTP
jgi:hypothetical protein